RPTGRIGDAGHQIARVTKRDRVAVGVYNGTASQRGVEVVLDLTLRGERVGVVGILDQLIEDTGRSGKAAVYILGELVGQIVAPVNREVAGAVHEAVDVEGVRPLLSERRVLIALAVMHQRQRYRQPASGRPADDGNGRQLVAVDAVDLVRGDRTDFLAAKTIQARHGHG